MIEFSSDAERWMRQAIREAEIAAEEGEVPVGCVIVLEGRVIGRGHNRVEALQDPTAHAEMLALTASASTVGSWRLTGAEAFVTVEPCVMCAGALTLARVGTIWFGSREPKFGACGSVVNIPALAALNHHARVIGGILENESAALMRDFFRSRRVEGREPEEADRHG